MIFKISTISNFRRDTFLYKRKRVPNYKPFKFLVISYYSMKYYYLFTIDVAFNQNRVFGCFVIIWCLVLWHHSLFVNVHFNFLFLYIFYFYLQIEGAPNRNFIDISKQLVLFCKSAMQIERETIDLAMPWGKRLMFTKCIGPFIRIGTWIVHFRNYLHYAQDLIFGKTVRNIWTLLSKNWPSAKKI